MKHYSTQDIIEAHRFSSKHKPELLDDTLCGCFYCLKIFKPNEISDWVMDPIPTALCPYCCVDAIIGAYAGYPISDEFLKAMHTHWFDYSKG